MQEADVSRQARHTGNTEKSFSRQTVSLQFLHLFSQGVEGFPPAEHALHEVTGPERADTGIVRSLWEMFNQIDEKVLQMEGYGMFRRRHPATEEELARLQAGGS